MVIKNSQQWMIIRRGYISFMRKTHGSLFYNHPLYINLNNIESVIKELSKVEVLARQRKTNRLLNEHLEKVNDALQGFENDVLMYELRK
jgi:hypothetical protein